MRVVVVAAATVLASAAVGACDRNNGTTDTEPRELPGGATPAGGESELPGDKDRDDPLAAQNQPPAAQDQPATPNPDYERTRQEFIASCPTLLDGVEVDARELPDGVALTFTTKTGDVDQLRERVRQMGRMYEMHEGHGAMMWHHQRHTRDDMDQDAAAGVTGEDPQVGPMPAAKARVEEVEDGARLELRATEPGQAVALREQIRAGECVDAKRRPKMPDAQPKTGQPPGPQQPTGNENKPPANERQPGANTKQPTDTRRPGAERPPSAP